MKKGNPDCYKLIKRIEKKTLDKILGDIRKKQQKRIVNPFTNLLFIKLVYESWYNESK